MLSHENIKCRSLKKNVLWEFLLWKGDLNNYLLTQLILCAGTIPNILQIKEETGKIKHHH